MASTHTHTMAEKKERTAARTFSCLFVSLEAMARPLLKIQRYFRRKPVRFFSFILLYLTAGSLVFLHSGFSGDSGSGGRHGPLASVEGGTATSTEGLGIVRRAFSDMRTTRRLGLTWTKAKISKEPEEGRAKLIGCYVDDTHQRALRGISFFDYKKMTVFRCQDNCAERNNDLYKGYLYAGLEFGAECYCGHRIQAANVSDSECNMQCKGEKSKMCGGANRLSIYRLELSQESARRYGSAIFKGCFRRPDNVTLALPAAAVIQNMSVDKCVDMCTEKEFSLAALAGIKCHCGFPTSLFTLHEPEEEDLCLNRCAAEDFESCGNDEYFVVYQTQVQDNRCMDRRFLPTRSKRLTALASFPGAGNTWARHLIELATGYYTGSYYFDGSLYNKGFKGERDHWRSGRTICIKTHESGKKEIEAYDSSILMIRNPYKALMAEFNRKYGGHIGFASQAHWKGKAWFQARVGGCFPPPLPSGVFFCPSWAEVVAWLFCLVVDVVQLFCSVVDIARLFCSAVDVARLFCSAVDVARLFCSAVDVARLFCSAVDIARLFCLAVDIARLFRSAVDVTRLFCSAVDIAWDPLALPLCSPHLPRQWPEFVKNYAPWWASHTLDWLQYGKNVHLVHFEELKHDLFTQLKHMVLFLGLDVSEDRLLCVVAQKDGNFKRSGLRKLEYDPYTPEMREKIDDLIRSVDVALKLRNLSGVPDDYRPR
ncbi:hypothetical protein QTP70_018667 [Hemibagrus guttatus]|uniref:WSC domain-containing protein n=1 Tax=Hemibagrus guttatus TaxID=175788 RepID=A0AAE0UQ31_9TELE|nr:hypothetical protein QTP70_018667 [Hemibagrus guttatus]